LVVRGLWKAANLHVSIRAKIVMADDKLKQVFESKTFFRNMGLSIGLLIALFAAWNWWQDQDKKKNIVAFDALYQATKGSNLEPSQIKDKKLSELSSDLAKLQEVSTKHPGTLPAALADFKQARSYFFKGSYQKALELYQSISKINLKGEAQLFTWAAYNGQVACLEALNKNEEALKVINKALSLDSKHPMRALFYLSEARNLEALKKIDQALKSYEKVLSEFPGSPYEQKASVLKALLTTGSAE